jgi:hypothetical protein
MMLRLVQNWRGEATEDQRATNAEIVAALEQVTALTAKILLDTDLLKVSGFKPTAGRAGVSKEPLAAGTPVMIQEDRFSPVYGDVNDFEVVVDDGKQVRLRVRGDMRSPQVIVNRAWLEKPDDGTDADADADADVNEGGVE